MKASSNRMCKVIGLASALWLLSGCELLPQLSQKDIPPVIPDTGLCETAREQADFAEFCYISNWLDYALEANKIEWSARLATIKDLGDSPNELIKKVLLSQSTDTPYQNRLRAQNWILALNTNAPKVIRTLLNELIYKNNTQLLEFESAITILSKVNARQEKKIAELQTSLVEREQQIQKQQSQVDQLLKIETDLIEQNRK